MFDQAKELLKSIRQSRRKVEARLNDDTTLVQEKPELARALGKLKRMEQDARKDARKMC